MKFRNFYFLNHFIPPRIHTDCDYRLRPGLTLESDSGEEVSLWLLTSLCTSAKREVEVAL